MTEDGPTQAHKYCHTCQETKPVTAFYRNTAHADGHSTLCRTCQKAAVKRRYYAHLEAERARSRRYQQANPEKKRANQRRYVTAHREALRAKQRQYYPISLERKQVPAARAAKRLYDQGYHKDNAEKIRAKIRHWRRTNPLRLRLYSTRRAARKRLLPATLTPAAVSFAMQYWHYACAICGRENGLWHVIALDHWIPLASEHCPGTIPGNIVPLCHGKKGMPAHMGSCNRQKSDQDPLVWLTQKFGPRHARQKYKAIELFFARAVTQESALAPPLRQRARVSV